MAAIINASAYPSFVKITPDNGTPNSYYVFPKGTLYVDAANNRIRLISDPAANVIDFSIDSSTIDENGNALNTADKVADYLSSEHLIS